MINRFFHFLRSILNINNKWITIIIPILFLGLFFLLVTKNNVHMETYDIERFERAKQTIHSPVTIENKTETERKIRETIQALEDRYSISDEITEERLQYIEEIFDAIATIENQTSQSDGTIDDRLDDEGDFIAENAVTDLDRIEQLNQILSEDISQSINDTYLLQLLRMNEQERDEGQQLLEESVSAVLEEGVRTENIQSALGTVNQTIKYSDYPDSKKEVLEAIAKFAVVENSFFDMEKTMEAEKSAASNVEPSIIRSGDIIVTEGQVITNEIYEDLKLVGLLDHDRNVYPILGLSLLILLIISVIAYEMNRLAQREGLDGRTVISIVIISIIVVSLMKIVSIYSDHLNKLFYVVPVATGVLLVKQLVNERLAIVLAMLFSLLGGIIFNENIPGSLNVEAGVFFLFSQLAAIIFLKNVKDRLSIVRAGIGLAVTNLIIVAIFVLLSFEKFAFIDLFLISSYALASALLSAVLTIGLLPFFETSLGILSDIKLLSLSSPNHPLLRKLLVEAPGTYHHSIMVANLSETACEAVGANGLLARVGAYYHDIGKTVRPHYFIENQLAIKNPHDLLAPKKSAKIIISHPYDGAKMLQKHRLPKEIVDIAKQHHGTTLLKYFYFKAKKADETIAESEFRYPGPKPQTIEAAIISICDSVEAAVRSLQEPTESKIEEIVSSIINDRLTDGQLEECPITIKQLKDIQTTICETLKGIFHSRIQYPQKEAK